MYDTRTLQNLERRLGAVWTVNRLGGMLGLNVGYFLVIVAAAGDLSVVADRAGLLGLLFVAVIAMKCQASNADAIHDYDADRENPHKTHVPWAVDTLGRSTTKALLGGQLLVSMAAWTGLTWATGNPGYVAAGVVSNALGVTYSFPPRFKERGFLNHVVTTTVDAFCVVLPGVWLVLGGLTPLAAALVVFTTAYVLAFHIMHQAADTYYDRVVGISTFTQSVGVADSVLVSSLLSLSVGVFAICFGLLLIGVGGLAFGAFLYGLYRDVRGKTEKRQSDVVSERFSVSYWATGLNALMAASMVVAQVLVFSPR